MTEFRNRMNEVIDKLKRNEADLVEENETLQQQAQLKWTLQTLKDLLEGDLTMCKWDQLVVILVDHGLEDFL